MNRRFFLIAAGASGLALVAGSTAFALTRTPTAALEPWGRAGLDRSDPRLFVIEHAILAPNPHNRQAWVVELTSPSTMTLWCDLARRLPQTDPFDRQTVIGLGAFVEIASLAASAIGYKLDVTPFPEGEPRPRLDQRPIAHFTLVRDASITPDPLFAQVKTRRSTKLPMDMTRSVPATAIAAFSALGRDGTSVAVVSEPGVVARVRTVTLDAFAVESFTPRTHKESVELMRIGRAEIEANPDGISIGGPLLDSLALVGQLSRKQLIDPQSSASTQGLAMFRTMLTATPAYLTVTTPGETRADELLAGRLYLRANLTATAQGLAMHPVSQALQEFPEMAEQKAAVETALGVTAPKRLQMLARLGYGPAMPAAPRWAAATRIKTA
jgi:hypothetical protein